MRCLLIWSRRRLAISWLICVLVALSLLAWSSAVSSAHLADVPSNSAMAQSPLDAPLSPLEAAATDEAELLALASIERAPISVTASGNRYSLTLVAFILAGVVVVAALLVWRRE